MKTVGTRCQSPEEKEGKGGEGEVRKVRLVEVKVSGLRVSSQKSARAIGELRSLTLRLVWPKAASQ